MVFETVRDNDKVVQTIEDDPLTGETTAVHCQPNVGETDSSSDGRGPLFIKFRHFNSERYLW